MRDQEYLVLGGGGFSMEPENQKLDKYLISMISKSKPKICFLPTASADSESYTERFYQAFNKLDCETSHLSLFKPHTRDMADFLLNQDVIYVGGGNTKNLLCLWKEWSLDKILKDASYEGVILAGISAGMICWFEQGLTDSFGDGTLEPLDCLGFLTGSACPHYDGEPERQNVYESLIATKQLKEGIALDDGAAAHYVNGELKRIVTSRKGARAYQIKWKDSQSHRHELNTRFLG